MKRNKMSDYNRRDNIIDEKQWDYDIGFKEGVLKADLEYRNKRKYNNPKGIIQFENYKYFQYEDTLYKKGFNKGYKHELIKKQLF